MALGEVKLRDWWRVIRRELGAGLVLGTFLGIIGFLRITLWHSLTGIYGEHYLLIALTVFGSLIGVVTFGTMTGSLLPLHSPAASGSTRRAPRHRLSQPWWT